MLAETLACPGNGRSHLGRRGAADVITGIHRALQGQHGENVLVDLGAEVSELLKTELGQVAVTVDAVAHGLADDLVGIPERHTFADQVVGDHLETREAVRLDDTLPYDEPWGWMQPTRHALGALLLEQGRVVEAEAAPGEVPLELDGDPLGCLPARFEVVPAAVSLLGSAP